MEKPRNVVLAIRLIWLLYVTSIFLFFIVDIKEMPEGISGPILVFTVYAVEAFVNCKISRGQNWARIIFMVDFVFRALLHCLYLLLPIGRIIPLSYDIFTLPLLIIKTFALFLLFTKPANAWFRNSQLGKRGKIFFIAACSLLVIFYSGLVPLLVFYSNNLASFAFFQGYHLAEARRFDKAIEQYSISIKSDPNNAYAYMGRAEAYEELGKHDLAKCDVDKASKLGFAKEPRSPVTGEMLW